MLGKVLANGVARMNDEELKGNRYTCEQCEFKEAIVYCARCAEDDDPFLYCEECSKVAHHGRKQCYHQVETIAEHAKNMDRIKLSISNLQRIIELSSETLEKETEKVESISVGSVEEKVIKLFDELRTMIDQKEKEVIAQCQGIKTRKLNQLSRKRDIFLKEKASAEKTIQNVTENAEDVLMSTKPHLLDDTTAKITKQLDEKGNVLERLRVYSPFPTFTDCMGVIPQILYLKDAMKKYSLPEKLEWEEGDTIKEVFIYNTKPLFVRSNHFWVWEYISEDTNTALFHHSEMIKAMMSEEREPLQDVRPDTLVCAYYGEEASWHRGLAERTFERKGKKLVSVRFLDYGNVEEVPLEWVAELPPEFTEYPFQCRLCHFSDEVFFNDREVKWAFMDAVKGRKMTAKVLERTYQSGSVLPLFSVELYDEQDTNIGLRLWKLIQERSAKNQEDFPIMYRDIRYKGGTSDAFSPLPSNSWRHSPSAEDMVLKTLNAKELAPASSDNSLRGSEAVKKTPEPVEDISGTSSNQEVQQTSEETKELIQESGDSSREVNDITTPTQGFEDHMKEEVLEEKVQKVDDGDDDVQVRAETSETTEKESHNIASTENEDDSATVEVITTPTDTPTRDEISQSGSESNRPIESLLVEDPSPLSNRAHTSSSPSSFGPVSSPSQVISQSQSDSYHSPTPLSQMGADSIDSDETESEAPPTFMNKEVKDIIISPTSQSEDSHCSDIKKPPGNLTIEIDMEGFETKEKPPDIPRDYVPTLHPIIFEGANLSLLVNSSLFQDGSFWAQLVLKDEEQALYDKLSDNLQDYSSCKGEYTPVFFEPGDFCMALFSEDGLWYRGVVEEGGEEENCLHVRFLDFGNSELVDIPNVMALKTSFRQLPFQSIKCSLASEDKTVFTEEECEKFDDCFCNENLITATVLSVDGETAFVKATVCETDADLLSKVVTCSQMKSRSYSFEMPGDEETRFGNWADRMEEDNVFMSDTELTKERQKKNKLKQDIRESLSGGETTLAERECVKRTERKNTRPSESVPLVSPMKSSQTCHTSSSSSVSSHSSHTRCSVDTSSVTKFLKLYCSPEENVEKSKSIDNGGTKTADEMLSRRSPSPDGRRFDSDSRKQRKGSFGRSGRRKGRGEGRGVLMTRWGSDKEVRPGEGRPSSSVPPSSSEYSRSSSFSRKRQAHRKKAANMVTVLVFGLCKYSISETYGLFNKYGSVADVRKNTKVRDSFYIDIDRDSALKAKDALFGKKISDDSKRTMEVLILDG